MPEFAKIAIVAALKREIQGLVDRWSVVRRTHQNRNFEFFESQNAVAVWAGIGAEAARRAAEAVVTTYKPTLLISAGFAGALDSELKVGQIFLPSRVIDAKDGSTRNIVSGQGVLLSTASIAGTEAKARLANAYGAQAIDMEAAAVGRVAELHGIGFAVVKAISDERDFEMPAMDRFVTGDGQFRDGAFALYAALRPWLWPRVVHLARNSASASRSLCRELERQIRDHVPAVPAEARTFLN